MMTSFFQRMLALWRGSFRLRLTVGLTGAILLIMTLGSGVMLYFQNESIRQSAIERGRAFSHAFAMMGATAVIDNLFLIQEAMLQDLHDPDLLLVDVVDTDNMIVASRQTDRIGLIMDDPQWLAARTAGSEVVFFEQGVDGTPLLIIIEPLLESGEMMAWIRMVFSLDHVNREMWAAMVRLGLVTLILILVSIVVIHLFFHRISLALQGILERLQSSLSMLKQEGCPPGMQMGHADPVPLRPAGQGEFEQVTSLVAETTQLLQQQSNTIQEVMNSLETKVRERTVELEAARDQALESTRTKSVFLATMSHEIRTPLNGVLGMTELMLASGLPPQQQAHAEAIQRSGRTLLAILDDILNLSKIEAGKITLETIAFQVGTVLERVVELVGPQASEKGLNLTCVVHPGVPSMVTGDPIRLGQILLNLLGNAVKFTEQGDIGVEVTVDDGHKTAAREQIEEGHRIEGRTKDHPQFIEDASSGSRAPFHLLRFAIRDTGIGISPEAQATIFDSFTQADSSTTRHYGGTGLGLAISKQLVKMMGGAIGVTSELGRGSTFWFAVPLIEAPESNHGDVPLASGEAGSCEAGPPFAAGVRVLVVEDDSINRDVARGMLQFLGCIPDCAQHGQAALEKLCRHSYDLILMDCQMPVMDGLEATKAIRSREAGNRETVEVKSTELGVANEQKEGMTSSPSHVSRIPIIAMTANVMAGEREKCVDAGMDDYLSKPLSIHDLERILIRWCSSTARGKAHNVREMLSCGIQDSPPEEEASLDRRVLDSLQSFGGPNASVFLKRILIRFNEETPQWLGRLRDAERGGDFTAMKRLAHTMKGRSGALGAVKLDRLCGELEDLLEGDDAQRILEKLVSDIETECDRVSRLFRETIEAGHA